MIDLTPPITALPGIGEKKAAAFRKLGISTFADMIGYFPRKYDDRSRMVPIAMAIPRSGGPLLMDIAVSQYAYGKMEVMAKAGKVLDVPCGENKEGKETCDPREIISGGVMTPMAMWKGNALSVMLDLMAATLSGGKTSLDLGPDAAKERGMSQAFIAMHPAAVGDMEEIERRMQKTLDFLHGLEVAEGMPSVRAPGERLEQTRARHAAEGIPVAQDTWTEILNFAEK